MQNIIVILGTGGTIAGTAVSPFDHLGYTAAQLGVAQLVSAVPALQAEPIECEQVAQIDSKDMSFDVWQRLAQRVAHHLARDAVAGVVITHGTDTLEETAYFLQRLLAPSKPVVLTAAMRPATSAQADGPQNLHDAVRVAQHAGAHGVVAVLAGAVHSAVDVRKAFTDRIDAFSSGDAGPLAVMEEGGVRVLRAWPQGATLGTRALALATPQWPRVEIVMSYAGAQGQLVRALSAAGVRGMVVAGTGNGTVHCDLEAALLEAQAQGVRVLRSTRCAQGGVAHKPTDTLPSAAGLTPVKARVELMLSLM